MKISTNPRIAPLHVRVLAIDETWQWTLDDWPEIKAVRGVWLYDLNEATHLCEITPSRCLWPVETYPEFDPQVEMTDEREEYLLDEVRRCAYIDGFDPIYIHCHVVDAMPGRTFDTETVSFDEVDYKDQLEGWLEYARSNSLV